MISDAPEFSRPYALDRLGAAGGACDIAATPEECAALATRLDIPAVHALACRWRLRRGEAGRVDAEARLTARLTRICVVTLDEFETDAIDTFRVVFVPAGSESDDPDPESIDEVPYGGGTLDLGEAAAEQLALSLDPYPHKPGAALPAAAEDAEDDAPAPSPFEILARRQRGE